MARDEDFNQKQQSPAVFEGLNWIKVDEELQTVLVCTRRKIITLGAMHEGVWQIELPGWETPNENLSLGIGDAFAKYPASTKYEVTHWMPLPTPPPSLQIPAHEENPSLSFE